MRPLIELQAQVGALVAHCQLTLVHGKFRHCRRLVSRERYDAVEAVVCVWLTLTFDSVAALCCRCDGGRVEEVRVPFVVYVRRRGGVVVV